MNVDTSEWQALTEQVAAAEDVARSAFRLGMELGLRRGLRLDAKVSRPDEVTTVSDGARHTRARHLRRVK